MKADDVAHRLKLADIMVSPEDYKTEADEARHCPVSPPRTAEKTQVQTH